MKQNECWEAVLASIANGDYVKAVQICEAEPCSQHIECQRYLGWSFYKENLFDKALIWFGKAANQGDGESAFGIASIKFSQKDFGGALNHFEISANLGYTRALHWLGYIHHQGLGVPRNIERALTLYKQSASNGYLIAERALIHLTWVYGSFVERIKVIPRLAFLMIRSFVIAVRNPDDLRITDTPNAFAGKKQEKQ